MKVGLDIDDELEFSFSGMIFCYNAVIMAEDWIIDLGVSDYMTVNV